MPDNRAAASGSAKKRDKKSKAKANEKSSAAPTDRAKSNAGTKISSKNKQAKEETNAKEHNNNVNKSPKLNLSISKIIETETDDEIIKSKATGSDGDLIGQTGAAVAPDSANTANEEFDFDDTDLLELNDNSETTGVSIDKENANDSNVIQTTFQPLNQQNGNENEKHDTNTACPNNNEIATAISDKVDKEQSSSELVAAIELTKDGDDDDENSNLMSNKYKATPPAALELNETAEAVQETYCPITPRRIVDIEELEDDEAPNRVLRSSSSKTLVNSKMNINSESPKASKTNANELGTAKPSTTGDQADNAEDADYYDDDDEPDNVLLVQFLGEANQIAEARLAARRQARAEAREIRMRELERQQKEQEQNADRVFDMHTASGIDPLSRSRLTAGLNSSSPVGGLLNSARGSSMSSRRSSEDSLEEEGRSLRDIRHELRDVEERFRKAMIANAQLDNERASATYQIQLLKDKLEEMEELHSQLQREFKEKSRDCNALKRNLDKLSEELKLVQGQLNERDTLIAEQGLVIVTVENEDGSDAKRALVSCENAHLLGSVQGSLDVRLKKFSEEKQQLLAEVQQLQEQLENHKSQGKGRGGGSMNGPTSGDEEYEAQREANKIITEYKYKLQKAEQEIANLQASLQRSETQVIRYKSTAEAAEKAEAELKIERRKLQRENRETMERLEELETSNNHLLKRLDKLKNAKSALLKDL